MRRVWDWWGALYWNWMARMSACGGGVEMHGGRLSLYILTRHQDQWQKTCVK
jgi:hypothetical protein